MHNGRVIPLFGVAVSALVIACEQQSVTMPIETIPPAFAIMDAAHDAAASPHFYFLPPLVPPPSTNGSFDGALSPTAEVCATPACVSTLAVFTTGTGPDHLTVDALGESYGVVWQTKDVALTPGSTLRLRVLVGSLLLGYADISVVATSKELKDIPAGYLGLALGKPLVIKFRIETNVVAQVDVAPSTASVLVGATQPFTATLWDLHGNLLTGPTVTWSSMDPSVATVHPTTGVGTGVADGTTTIVATAEGVSGTAALTVQSLGWYPMTSGTTDLLSAVWGPDPEDLFAVGAPGVILHYDGSSWTPMSSGVSDTLLGVWGTSSTDVYASGENGTLLHYNGSAWTSITSGTSARLWDVWGTSPSNVYVVGQLDTPDVTKAVLLHFDGLTWSQVSLDPSLWGMVSIWGMAANDIYVAGDAGSIVHYDGTGWTLQPSGETMFMTGVWGSASTDVWAIGANGIVRHNTGSGWTQVGPFTTHILRGIWGSAANDVFIVGAGGIAFHYDGVSWTPMNSGTAEWLTDVWGFSATHVVAVGTDGVILRYGYAP
jgi:hypothetical protein